jgi:hypothetical protein
MNRLNGLNLNPNSSPQDFLDGVKQLGGGNVNDVLSSVISFSLIIIISSISVYICIQIGLLKKKKGEKNLFHFYIID